MSGSSEFPYETADADERNITMALLDLLDVDRHVLTDEDPLAAVCRIIAQNLPQVKFAIYCRKDDFVWRNSYVEDGFKVGPTPPLVGKLFLKYMWDGLGEGDVFGVEHGENLPFVRKSDIAKWKCRSCAAISVRNGFEREGLVVLFFLGNRKLDRRYLTWLKILSDTVSKLNRHQRLERLLRKSSDDFAVRGQEYARSLARMRSLVSTHVFGLERSKSQLDNGKITPSEAFEQALCGISDLLEISDVTVRERTSELRQFVNPVFANWVQRVCDSQKIKAFTGVRGGYKSRMLLGLRHWLISRGVPEERIISIDLESADFRGFKTARDMLAYLSRFPKCKGRRYLLLDEIGNLIWHGDLLKALYGSGDWNVWLAASSNCVLDGISNESLKRAFEIFYVWVDPAVPRTDNELRRIWGWIFMRDAVSGLYHADISAMELLSEYFSDHLGEAQSLREITAGMARLGHKLAPNTVASYRKALESAFLIETSLVYDVSAGYVRKKPGRVFWTDLELRKWRFGRAPDSEHKRLRANRLYLELRRRYPAVYTPYEGTAEFVTVEPDGSVREWSAGDKVDV